jgi:hypothetical protein
MGLIDAPGLQHVFQRFPGRDRGAWQAEVDHVGNRSIPDTARLMPHRVGLLFWRLEDQRQDVLHAQAM